MKITNFSKNDYFFIETPKFISYISEKKDKKIINPDSEEISNLGKLIKEYEKKLQKIKKNKILIE